MAPSSLSCSCNQRKTAEEYGFRALPLSVGVEGTAEYRIFFANQKRQPISPWHSIPLFADRGLLNMVCEIPRNTRAKYEVSTSEPGNPIRQDIKKGKVRFYGIDMKWNYGMFPQTWEDPTHASADCGGFVGDNDPVDVVEIGDHDPSPGAVYRVKPVAALAMIDEGELDWKVVAVAETDWRFDLVNDVAGVEMYFPGQLSAVREWFRTYKTHEGKALNKFELQENFVGAEYTMDVIKQTHCFWKALLARSRGVEGSGKVAVGDVPIVSSCMDTSEEEASAEVAATVESVLEALSISQSAEMLTLPHAKVNETARSAMMLECAHQFDGLMLRETAMLGA